MSASSVADSGGTARQARAVYLHVPFCRHRCGYCNFTLVAGRDHLIDDYLRAIEIELHQVAGRQPVDTIYLGGGTPSRLPAGKLEKLLELLERTFDFREGGEFTIEANPEDLQDDRVATIRQSAINRISLGVQSFHQEKLRSLDRDHSPRQIERAVEVCAGLPGGFSLDLIFAAPHDSHRIWQDDLTRAIHSGAGHVSTYELTLEKGTRFWNRLHHGELEEVDDQVSADYYEMAIERLNGAGLHQYEISSFARSGQRSRHNQVYWSGADYLAFGPGAASFVNGVRHTRHRSVTRYLKKVLAGESAIEESIGISPRELALERIIFGLRMLEGIDLSRFQEETGFTLLQVVPGPLLDRLVSQQLVRWTDHRLCLTRRGVFMGDYVCTAILSGDGRMPGD